MNDLSAVHTTLGYAEYYRQTYAFEQEHRPAGALNLFRARRRAPGSFTELPVRGPSLQITREPRRGTAQIDLGAGGFKFDLSAPAYVVAPPGQVCTYDLTSEIDLLVVEFPPEIFRDHPCGSGDLGPLHSSCGRDRLPMQLAEKLWELSAEGLTRLETDSLSFALATLLYRATGKARETRLSAGGLASWQLKRITEHLEDHLAEDVSIESLAAVIGLSPFHVARAFKASMGIPPHRYHVTRRVERAKEMLATTGRSVTEIAHACGFASSQHMATAFRRLVGTTPTEFRHQAWL